jgi:hypothetical protein
MGGFVGMIRIEWIVLAVFESLSAIVDDAAVAAKPRAEFSLEF